MTRAFIVALLLASAPAGHGQQPAVDAFTTCLADNTSGKDRKDLAKWVFLSMAAHPDLRAHLLSDAPTALDESSRRMAALVVRLLADDCVQQTKAVIQGGPTSQTFETAFARLGQLAMQEVMTEKSVQAAMGQFEKHIDKKRLDEALIGK